MLLLEGLVCAHWRAGYPLEGNRLSECLPSLVEAEEDFPVRIAPILAMLKGVHDFLNLVEHLVVGQFFWRCVHVSILVRPTPM